MTNKDKSLSYTLTLSSAQKQVSEAQQLYNLGKSLLETYLCSDHPVAYRDMAVKLLIDHSYNSKMYGEIIRDYIENGQRVATPLLLCLVCIELSDIIFAFDSVPADLG